MGLGIGLDRCVSYWIYWDIGCVGGVRCASLA